MNIKAQAFHYAINCHRGQLDDDGRDYFTAHCLVVGKTLEAIGCNPEVVAAGYCHDVLENTKVTYKELRGKLGETVANLVLEVTHEGTDDNIGYYFPRLKSREAILIKFADRLSNLSRMSSWDKKRQEHYLKKSRFWKTSPNENINQGD